MSTRYLAAASAVVLLSACGGSARRGPQASDDLLATYTLSGGVSEMTPHGPSPVSGARIEEAGTHVHSSTDGGGFYRLYGLSPGLRTFSTSKPGYITDRRDLSINGDTRLNIQLRRVETGRWSFRRRSALPLQEAPRP